MKKIILLSGSLRKGSYATKIAKAVADLFPEGYETKLVNIEDLHFYREDYDTEEFVDETYIKFREEIEGLDGAIFVTPEYNRSTAPALKNALDVGSRGNKGILWEGVPAAVISHSTSRLGGFGANHHLRQSLVFFNMPVVQQPEAYISFSDTMFDEDGNLINDDIKNLLQEVVNALIKLIEKN